MGRIMVHQELYRILVMQVVPVNGQQQLLIQQPQGSNQQPQIIQVITSQKPSAGYQNYGQDPGHKEGFRTYLFSFSTIRKDFWKIVPWQDIAFQLDLVCLMEITKNKIHRLGYRFSIDF
jgi:hypothetical protein